METDYMYMNDTICAINEDVTLMFRTIASYCTNNRTHYNCTEFKLNNNASHNVMIKRNLSYYLYIDDRRSGRSEKIYIYPENMFALLDAFHIAKTAWYEGSGGMQVYGYLDSTLTVVSDVNIIIKLPLDKVIKIAPGVMKTESGDYRCLDLYLNTPDKIQLTLDAFYGMYYSIDRLDMLSYANTSLTFMMLRNDNINRIDYSGGSHGSIGDNSTASGSTGRSFNGSSIKKNSLLS